MSKYIFYCKNCRNAFSGDDGVKSAKLRCPDCNCITIPTLLKAEDWRSKTEEEKENLKKEFDKKESHTSSNVSEKNNKVANNLLYISYIYGFLSILGSLIMLVKMNPVIGCSSLLMSILGTALLFGFAEIINLLQDIKNK